jgi:hypothetical protein
MLVAQEHVAMTWEESIFCWWHVLSCLVTSPMDILDEHVDEKTVTKRVMETKALPFSGSEY